MDQTALEPQQAAASPLSLVKLTDIPYKPEPAAAAEEVGTITSEVLIDEISHQHLTSHSESSSSHGSPFPTAPPPAMHESTEPAPIMADQGAGYALSFNQVDQTDPTSRRDQIDDVDCVGLSDIGVVEKPGEGPVTEESLTIGVTTGLVTPFHLQKESCSGPKLVEEEGVHAFGCIAPAATLAGRAGARGAEEEVVHNPTRRESSWQEEEVGADNVGFITARQTSASVPPTPTGTQHVNELTFDTSTSFDGKEDDDDIYSTVETIRQVSTSTPTAEAGLAGHVSLEDTPRLQGQENDDDIYSTFNTARQESTSAPATPVHADVPETAELSSKTTPRLLDKEENDDICSTFNTARQVSTSAPISTVHADVPQAEHSSLEATPQVPGKEDNDAIYGALSTARQESTPLPATPPADTCQNDALSITTHSSLDKQEDGDDIYSSCTAANDFPIQAPQEDNSDINSSTTPTPGPDHPHNHDNTSKTDNHVCQQDLDTFGSFRVAGSTDVSGITPYGHETPATPDAGHTRTGTAAGVEVAVGARSTSQDASSDGGFGDFKSVSCREGSMSEAAAAASSTAQPADHDGGFGDFKSVSGTNPSTSETGVPTAEAASDEAHLASSISGFGDFSSATDRHPSSSAQTMTNDDDNTTQHCNTQNVDAGSNGNCGTDGGADSNGNCGNDSGGFGHFSAAGAGGTHHGSTAKTAQVLLESSGGGHPGSGSGAVGNFSGAPEPTPAQVGTADERMAAQEDGDDAGFGEFSSGPEPALAQVGTADEQRGAQGDDNDVSFGDFSAVPEPPLSLVKAADDAMEVAEDDDDDAFGDFSAVAAAPTTQHTGTGEYSGALLPTGATAGVRTSAPESDSNTPVVGQNDAAGGEDDEDDDFGDFSTPTSIPSSRQSDPAVTSRLGLEPLDGTRAGAAGQAAAVPSAAGQAAAAPSAAGQAAAVPSAAVTAPSALGDFSAAGGPASGVSTSGEHAATAAADILALQGEEFLQVVEAQLGDLGLGAVGRVSASDVKTPTLPSGTPLRPCEHSAAEEGVDDFQGIDVLAHSGLPIEQGSRDTAAVPVGSILPPGLHPGVLQWRGSTSEERLLSTLDLTELAARAHAREAAAIMASTSDTTSSSSSFQSARTASLTRTALVTHTCDPNRIKPGDLSSIRSDNSFTSLSNRLVRGSRMKVGMASWGAESSSVLPGMETTFVGRLMGGMADVGQWSGQNKAVQLDQSLLAWALGEDDGDPPASPKVGSK